jgi:hypothetical protein
VKRVIKRESVPSETLPFRKHVILEIVEIIHLIEPDCDSIRLTAFTGQSRRACIESHKYDIEKAEKDPKHAKIHEKIRHNPALNVSTDFQVPKVLTQQLMVLST